MSALSATTRVQTDLYTTTSPNGKVTHTIYLEDGQLFHHVMFQDIQILAPSSMGLKTTEVDFHDGVTFVSTDTTSWHNTYTLPAGKKSVHVDNPVQREYVVQRDSRQLKIIIRVYDDGIAFRYFLAAPGATFNDLFIEEEYTEYNISTGNGGWGQPWVVNYETQFRYYSPGSVVDDLAMPFLTSYNNDTVWALFTEASLYNANATYTPSVLKGSIGGQLSFIHAPDPDQAKLGGRIQLALPFQSPWRAVIIADNLNDLVTSSLVQNVNPESRIDDTSWIKPGRVAWSWWSTYSFTDSDNMSPNSTQRIQSYQQQRDYVDFAASMGWEYVTVDAGWVNWIDGTVKELCEYASGKGVGIVLWASYELWSPYGSSLMNIKTWASWGVAGIKIDIIEKDSQIGMAFMEEMAVYCAELGLLLNLHSMTKAGGEERTWPNIITTEAVAGNEHYWLYWPPPNNATHNCALPFTRNVVGSMDYTPVALSNRNRNTTQGHQLAQSVVYESGMQHFADSIDIYAVWRGTEFLSVVHAAWDETKVLEGVPGRYVTMARRKGADWCIGAMTTDARSASIQLSSLNLEDGDYTAYIYKDGESMDFLIKEISTVNSASVLTIPMLESGGCAILISKTTVPRMPIDPFTPYEAEDATLVGAASISDSPNASGGKKVGNLGFTGEVIFNVNVPRTDTYRVRLYYLSADPRTISCSINGGPGYDLEIAFGSGSWDVVRIFPTSMALNAGNNTIRLYHHEWAPDIDKIGILIDSYRQHNRTDRFSYTGNWATTGSGNFSNGIAMVTSEDGAAFEFAFNGTAFRVISRQGETQGTFDVYIDGEFVTNVDLYAADDHYNVTVYENDTLAQNTHKVKLVAHISETRNVVTVDAVEVNGALLDANSLSEPDAADLDVRADFVRYEEADRFRYTGIWNTRKYDALGYTYLPMETRETDAALEFAFHGTAFKIIGVSGPITNRMFAVYIDGEYITSVITYNSAAFNFSTLFYENDSLANDTHHVKLVVLSSGPADHYVSIRAIEIKGTMLNVWDQ